MDEIQKIPKISQPSKESAIHAHSQTGETSRVDRIIHRHPYPQDGATNYDPSQDEAIARINRIMLQIFLDPKDIDEHNVLPFIRYILRKFNLLGSIDEIDILIEVYTTAIKKIREENYQIKRPPYWFKGTALNLIRQISREMSKDNSLTAQLRAEQRSVLLNQENSFFDTESNNKVAVIAEAMNSLSQSDRKILNLRIVAGLSWSDVAERLVDEGEESTFDSNLIERLRKRGQRALKRLRARYYSLLENEVKD